MDVKPPIVISAIDADRIDQLLERAEFRTCAGRAELLAELDRARVVAPEAMPADVVTMNSRVRFREQASGREFSLTLCYPNERQETDALSILAPVGSALLGLREGDQIEWPAPSGSLLKVAIIEVEYQPERAGLRA